MDAEYFVWPVVFYIIFGFITAACMTFGGVIDETVTFAELGGILLLWPLFAIKYLALGIWAVLSSGFTLLF